MTDTSQGRNLPAIAKLVGGAALEVLGWPDHTELSGDQISKIMVIVQGDPELNTLPVVDMLADAATHHGENLGKWFEGVVRQHGVANVHECLEIMWDIGARSATRMTSSKRELQERDDELVLGLQFIEALKNLRFDISDAHAVSNLVDRLGGWEEARNMSHDDLSEFLFAEQRASEFDEEMVGEIGMSEADKDGNLK